MPTRPSSSGGCHRGPGVCLRSGSAPEPSEQTADLQEWKGGDEHPREGGRGSNSGIFRAYEEGQRAGASKPCGLCQVRPSYRSLVCI